MNIKIDRDVVFIPGACNGAIYDFKRNKIFSVNEESKNFLLRYVQGETAQTIEEKEYLSFLQQNAHNTVRIIGK